MPDSKELLKQLNEMYEDPELREFRPLISEIKAGIESPEYDNISQVIELFQQTNSFFICRKLAEASCINASMNMHQKKWYEK